MYEYESITEAAKINNIDDGAIWYAAKNKTTSKEFLWSFEKVDKLDFSRNLQRKNVYLYTTDGEFETSFSSISECAEFLGVTYAPVQRAFHMGGKIKGYYIYKEKLTNFIPEKIRLEGEVH